MAMIRRIVGVPDMLAPLVRHFRNPTDTDAFFIGPGWVALVRRCHDEVVEEFPDYELLAVKQKEGELAFQAWPRLWHEDVDRQFWEDDSRLDDITDRYAELSMLLCEQCGGRGTTRDEREYIETLCDDCEAVAAAETTTHTGAEKGFHDDSARRLD
jgi:hypothetical protein